MNRKRFAEYPEVAEVIVARRVENQSPIEEEEIKIVRRDLERANEQCELLKHKNERLKSKRKHLKKRVRELEEMRVYNIEKATDPADKKRFSGEKILETALRVIKGIAVLLNAVALAFSAFRKSKIQYGVAA